MDMVANYPLVKTFLAGSFSGTFSTILFQPLDLVKTRLQNPVTIQQKNGHPVGMLTIFNHILRHEHLKGLWKGITPSITRCVPGIGLYFCTLDYLKSTHCPDRLPTPIESVLLGSMARCLSTALLIPITVVKTRYESGVYVYTNLPSALTHIYKTEGLKGMTCGLVPTLIRDAPFSGLYLMFYTQTKLLVPLNWFDTHLNSGSIHFGCGLIAGVLASIVTQPADVLKTKMQLYPDKFNGHIWDVMVYVKRKYGFMGYFKGLTPRMLRRTLMAAMAWTIYEQLIMSMGLK